MQKPSEERGSVWQKGRGKQESKQKRDRAN